MQGNDEIASVLNSLTSAQIEDDTADAMLKMKDADSCNDDKRKKQESQNEG